VPAKHGAVRYAIGIVSDESSELSRKLNDIAPKFTRCETLSANPGGTMIARISLLLAIWICASHVYAAEAAAPAAAATPSGSSASFLGGKIFGKAENFTELNKERRRNVAEISALEADIRNLEQELAQLVRDSERSKEELFFLTNQLADINAELARRQEGNKGPRIVVGRRDPKTDRPMSPAEFLASQDSDRLQQEKKRVEQRQKDLSDKSTRIVTLQTELRKKHQDLDAKRTSNAELEERIAASLNIESNRYVYRSVISAIFALIVFYLMLRFFQIVSSDADVKKSIFSGEAGIQFITLFSIIIAVILFGILEILGSNELSALLGGLSGYILGRHQQKT
jgi:hypothetical protein